VDYAEARAAQDVRVVIEQPGDLQALAGSLRRSKVHRGRAVVRLSPVVLRYGLRRGDRLVQGGDLLDVHEPELRVGRAEVGAQVCFFRPGAGFLRLLSPLLEVPGVAFPLSVQIDLMHVADLGVTARYVGTCMRRALDSGRWGPPRSSVEACMAGLRADLQAYYACARARGAGLTELGRNFPVSLLGKARAPFFTGKARESRDLLGFAADLVRVPNPRLRLRRHLAAAGDALQRVYAALHRSSTRGLASEDHREALRAGLQFLGAWKKAGGHCTIKHHYFVHMLERAGAAGNPRRYSSYPDESKNRATKRIARSVGSGRAFARRVLARSAAAR
jgi:hypothetical protein